MRIIIPLMVLLLLFSGCEKRLQNPQKPKPNKKLSLSAEEEQHLFYLQKPFGEKEVTLLDKGNKLRLVAYNCAVLKPVVREGIVVKWKTVLRPPLFYPFAKCSRSTIKLTKNKYVEVFLGKTGFAAGGCCAVSGTYRTKNGINWEERKPRGKWQKYSVNEK